MTSGARGFSVARGRSLASLGPADIGMFLGGSSGGDMTLSTKRTAGTNVEKRLVKGSPVTGPTWDPSHMSAPRSDTIIDAMMCLQTVT